MTKKRINISPEAIDVLSSQIVWGFDNRKVTAVIVGQLDRKLYLKVNKALEALGGKWNRKAKAHLFTIDPRLQVETMVNDGHIFIEHFELFPTPQHIVRKMLDQAEIKPGMRLLEPSAGTGAILSQLYKFLDVVVDHCEIDPVWNSWLETTGISVTQGYGPAVAADFITYEPGQIYDRIIMNPPFSKDQDIEHVRHAYDLLKPGGRLVSIMSEGPFFRSDKKAVAFLDWLDVDVWSGDVEKLPEGSFKESGTMVNTRMVVLDKEQS